jgi:hypothetical protein
MNKKREKKRDKYSQTSRFENPEELQLHYNHENFLFLAVLVCWCSLHTAKCIIGD